MNLRFVAAACFALLLLTGCAPASPSVAPTTPAAGPATTPPTAAPATVETAATAVPVVPPTVGSTVGPVPVVVGSWTPPARTKTTGCVSQGGLPDPACTPGSLDVRVSITTAAATICTSGYTATVRPPVSVTDRIKREQMAAYGLQGQPLSGFELDHLVSLELGGAPQDVANLWPEPWTGDANAHMKDAVETHLKREVCRGIVSLAEAQRQIATDWLAVFKSNGLQPAP